MIRCILFVLGLSVSFMSTAQSWQPALWQTTEGVVDSGEVKLPKRIITGSRLISTRTPIDSPLRTDNLDWLVSLGDTVFVRRHHEIGTSTLYQLLVNGEFDLYRAVGKVDRFDWQLRSEEELIQLSPEGYLRQMNAATKVDCPDLGRKSNGRLTNYNLLLAAEDLNNCVATDAIKYSVLGKPLKWRLNFGIITPINLLNQGNDLGTYWGARVAAERNLRQLFNGLFFTAGIQPYYYQQDSDLTLGSLGGTYEQEWEMTAVQSNIGIKLEALPNSQFSPFGEVGLGIVFPISHKRHATLKDGEPQSPGFPIQSSLKGGMKTSYGTYIAYGVRAKYNEDWLVALQLSRDGMFVNIDYGDLSGGSRALFFGQDNALLIGEWLRWELLLQRQF